MTNYSSRCSCSRVRSADQTLASLTQVHKFVVVTSQQVVLPERRAVRGLKRLRELVDCAENAVSVPKSGASDFYVLENGTLKCLLSKESFYAFGLDGQRARDGYYLATYNLRTAGKRRDRLLWALENTMNFELDVYYVPRAASSAASSATASGATASGEGASRCEIWMPPLSPVGEDFTDWISAVTEFVGLCALNTQLLADPEKVDRALCAYDVLPSARKVDASIQKATGLFSSEDMQSLWAQTGQFAVLHAVGFGVRGECGYTLLKQNDEVHCLHYNR